MSWRLARGLEKLRSQVNAKWPNRSKDSDGSIGDEHHSARVSDHNPDGAGVVHAIDITHDPKGGFDSYAFADMLLAKQDHRLKYVISNRRIGSGPAGPVPGVWRKYSGINPHDHHCHISIMSGPTADNTQDWDINAAVEIDPVIQPTYVPPPATLRKGAIGDQVKIMQTLILAKGMKIDVDGDFGPETSATLEKFQQAHGLVADAVCGPMTWAALK
jgi:peptidoglycan hydrolase-like protein with peptidoglycan-binding domain